MKVVLLRPLFNETRNAPIFLPLGLLHLAAPLVDAGIDVSIKDVEFEHRVGRTRVCEDTFAADMCDPIIAQSPTIVGITALADTLPVALLLGRYLKVHAPEIVVVFGGQGLFGTAESVMALWPEAVDYVCRGEGEAVLLDLVRALESDRTRPAVPGTWMLRDGAIVDNGPAPLVDLEAMPPVPYELLPVSEYIELSSPPIFDIYIGSGCRYRCRFCTTAPFWSNRFRARSPRRVLREMEELEARFGVTEFNILHDNFADDRVWLEAWLSYFQEHNTRYRWGCSLRVDAVTPDTLLRFADAGCFRIFTGADSGSPRLLREMSKMGGTEKIYAFYEGCKAAGITCETNTIIGFPGETDADLELSLEVVFDTIGYGGAAPDVSVLQPLPGARVTLDGLDHLEWLTERPFGAFEPPEALAMAAAHPRVFAGFYFIRQDNRPHQHYAHLVRFVRYFSRHFFPVVYALKNLGVTSYVELFDVMRRAQQFGAAGLALAVATLGPRVGPVIGDLLTYCTIEGRLQGANAQQEIENIYSAPDTAPSAAFHCFTLRHPVHEMIAAFPCVEPLEPRTTRYLFHVADNGAVEKLRLPEWQYVLWTELRKGEVPADVLIADFIDAARAAQPGQPVAGPIRRASAYFREILEHGDERARPRVAPERRYIGRIAREST